MTASSIRLRVAQTQSSTARPRVQTQSSVCRRLALAAPVPIATAIAGPAAMAPAQALAHTKPLACRASVSIAHPEDYSTVVVYVSTVANARVSTAANYKTTTHVEYATASSRGQASTSYDISDATTGYKVIVDVSVRSGNRTGV